MKVLFLGGSGNISSACVPLAVAKGYDVTVLNRGRRAAEFGPGVKTILGDRNDPARMRQVADEGHYDVVANFIAYTPEQIELDLAAFQGRVGQYIFISSASVYQKPPNYHIITESTPLYNPYWLYSRNKIACEDRLVRAYREDGFPMTIVRPTYTYGPTWIPSGVGGQGYTVVDRMRQGLPVISHGDGASLWVMTYNADFAVGFVGLFGQLAAPSARPFTSPATRCSPGTRSTGPSARRPACAPCSWCTSLPSSSPPSIPTWAPGCWATRRTASSLTILRSSAWCPSSTPPPSLPRAWRARWPGAMPTPPRGMSSMRQRTR